MCLALAACDESPTEPQQASRIDPAVLETAEIHMISGNYQEGVVGSPLEASLVAIVVDAQGAPLAGAPVTWTFESGTGGAAETTTRDTAVTLTADGQGQVVVAWQLGTDAGTQHTWGVVGPASALSTGGEATGAHVVGFQATGVPDEPAEIIVSQSSLEIDEGESVTLTAVVVDQYGNEIPDVVVEWASSDSSIVSVESALAAPGISFAALPRAVVPAPVRGSRSDG